MELPNTDNWLLFTILFGLLLIVALIMVRQSMHFYTKDVIVRKFSIMELRVAATPKELVNLVKGLYALPPAQSQTSIAALKGQLKIGFLFMPLAYGCIFLLCWRVAHKMDIKIGYNIFVVFAFLQFIPLVCNIIENRYLLSKISSDVKETSSQKHKHYLWMEVAKWAISLTAAVCSVSAACYFWLTGKYSPDSFRYLSIFVIEMVLFLLAVKHLLSNKKRKVQK